DQQAKRVRVVVRPDLDVGHAVHLIDVDLSRDADGVEQPFHEIGCDLRLFVDVRGLVLRRRSCSDAHHRALATDPEDARSGLLDDRAVGLLLAPAELGESGLEGLLNGWGAFFDFLHCRSSCLRSSWTNSTRDASAAGTAAGLPACAPAERRRR